MLNFFDFCSIPRHVAKTTISQLLCIKLIWGACGPADTLDEAGRREKVTAESYYLMTQRGIRGRGAEEVEVIAGRGMMRISYWEHFAAIQIDEEWNWQRNYWRWIMKTRQEMMRIKSVWKYAQFEYLHIPTKTIDYRLKTLERTLLRTKRVEHYFSCFKCHSEISADRI